MARQRGAISKINYDAAEVARKALQGVNSVLLWRRFLRSQDLRIALEACKYLTDRIAGKPAQMIIGDPNRPIAVQISWSAGAPDWIDVTPEPDKIEP